MRTHAQVCSRFFESTTSLGCMSAVSLVQLSLGVLVPAVMVQVRDPRRVDRAFLGPEVRMPAGAVLSLTLRGSGARQDASADAEKQEGLLPGITHAPCLGLTQVLDARSSSGDTGYHLPHVQAKRWLLNT